VIEIENITAEAIQRHLIVLEESEVILTLRYYPKSLIWCFDAEFLNKRTLGIKLSVGALHMVSQNQPFDFEVIDNSQLGIDPFQITDFSSNRCTLLMLERDDMVIIRQGAQV